MTSPQEIQSDKELIDAVTAGDNAGFAPLMARYQQGVFDYLYHLLLRNRQTAEDLTQDVFLKAFRALASVDTRLPLKPWLMRIAHNEAANYLRGRARHPESYMEPEAWAQIGDSRPDNPENISAAQQEQARVNQALLKLKPRYREALLLYYHEEQSYEEIADILGVSLGTVGTLMHRGKAMLKTLLEPGEA